MYRTHYFSVGVVPKPLGIQIGVREERILSLPVNSPHHHVGL
jgi:hypothetical protein